MVKARRVEIAALVVELEAADPEEVPVVPVALLLVVRLGVSVLDVPVPVPVEGEEPDAEVVTDNVLVVLKKFE